MIGTSLVFTAPGDDLLCGTVDHYEVVTSDTQPATASDFASAAQLKPASPAAPGSPQSLNLAFNLRRYVAVRAVDDQGNVGRVALVDRGAPGAGGTNNGGGGGTNNGGGGGSNNGGGGCSDKLVPQSSISRKKLHTSRKKGIKAAGSSRDRGCAGLRRVDVVIARLTGKKCQFVRSNGRLTHRRKCRRLLLVKAHGTRSWSINLRHKLRAGRYRITVSGLDKKGNRELRRSGNTRNRRLR